MQTFFSLITIKKHKLSLCRYFRLVLIEFSSVPSLSHVQLFTTPWTAAHQAPLSMEFSTQEYWSGLPFPSPQPRDPTPVSCFSCIAGRFFTSVPPGRPLNENSSFVFRDTFTTQARICKASQWLPSVGSRRAGQDSSG